MQLTKKKRTGGRKNRKWGRNKKFCERYLLEGRREKNKKRRAKKEERKRAKKQARRA